MLSLVLFLLSSLISQMSGMNVFKKFHHQKNQKNKLQFQNQKLQKSRKSMTIYNLRIQLMKIMKNFSVIKLLMTLWLSKSLFQMTQQNFN